jgi:hypothetical protein
LRDLMLGVSKSPGLARTNLVLPDSTL